MPEEIVEREATLRAVAADCRAVAARGISTEVQKSMLAAGAEFEVQAKRYAGETRGVAIAECCGRPAVYNGLEWELIEE